MKKILISSLLLTSLTACGGGSSVDTTMPTDTSTTTLVDSNSINTINSLAAIQNSGVNFAAEDFTTNSKNEVVATKVANEQIGNNSSTNDIYQITLGGKSVGLSYADFGYWKDAQQTKDASGNLLSETNANYDIIFTENDSKQMTPNATTKFTGKAYATLSGQKELIYKMKKIPSLLTGVFFYLKLSPTKT